MGSAITKRVYEKVNRVIKKLPKIDYEDLMDIEVTEWNDQFLLQLRFNKQEEQVKK